MNITMPEFINGARSHSPTQASGETALHFIIGGKRMHRTVMILAVILTMTLGMTACKEKTASEAVSDAAESAEQATGDAARAAGNAVDDAAEATGDAVEAATRLGNVSVS